MSKTVNRNFIINDNITKTITLNLQEFTLIQRLCETDLNDSKRKLNFFKMHGYNDTDYVEKMIFLCDSIIRKIEETSFDR